MNAQAELFAERNLKHTGRLSIERFVACKALTVRTFLVKDIAWNKIVKIENNSQTKIQIHDVNIGDTIAIPATYTPITGGQSVQAAPAISNIQSVYLNGDKMMIESPTANIVNFDCMKQLIELMNVLETKQFEKDGMIYENWANKDIVQRLFPTKLTYKDFKSAVDKDIQREQSIRRPSIEDLFGSQSQTQDGLDFLTRADAKEQMQGPDLDF